MTGRTTLVLSVNIDIYLYFNGNLLSSYTFYHNVCLSTLSAKHIQMVPLTN